MLFPLEAATPRRPTISEEPLVFDTYAATITVKPGEALLGTYEALVRAQVTNPSGPVRIVGTPGDGKVSGLHSVLDEAGIASTFIVAPFYGPDDLALSFPIPAQDGKGVEWRPTSLDESIKDNSVLIIDDYDRRHPSIDDALTALAQDPRFRQVIVISNTI